MARIKMPPKSKAAQRRMVDKTKANAYRTGQRWTDDEVGEVMNGIEKDDTTFNMAMGIGRSYYAVQTARAHIRFAMDHSAVLIRAERKRKK